MVKLVNSARFQHRLNQAVDESKKDDIESRHTFTQRMESELIGVEKV